MAVRIAHPAGGVCSQFLTNARCVVPFRQPRLHRRPQFCFPSNPPHLLLSRAQISKNHGQVSKNHGQVLKTHVQVSKNHAQVSEDHGQVSENHAQVSEDHGQVLKNHVQVLKNHAQVSEDHGQVSKSHVQVSEDHGQVLKIHGQVSEDHAQFRVPAETPRTGNRAWADDDEGGVVWTASAIANAVKGTVITFGSPGSICTDTRAARPGQWYLALQGHNFDGHGFLQQAADAQCAGVIANWVPPGWSRGFVHVNGDTLQALQALAADVRRRFGRPVVGITGSVGKTTVRAMAALALENLHGYVHETKGNRNNHVGLPLTLLALRSRSVACVLELGMNHEGEILELAEIAMPDVRVLLNVGPAHMANFPGGLVEVAAAKGEIFRHARPGDVCVVNADDPLAMAVPLPAGVRVVRFGRNESSDMRLVAAKATNGGLAVSVTLEHLAEPTIYAMGVAEAVETRTRTRARVEFEIPSPGLHLAMNACAAAAITASVGVPLESTARSLSRFQPVDMRCRVEDVTVKNPISGRVPVLVINDCYNANPMSVEASLQLLRSVTPSRRRIAVLGDMLELGDLSLRSHQAILQRCVDCELDLVIVVGSCFVEAAQDFQGRDQDQIVAFPNAASLVLQIARFVCPGDAVLVKGSRGMRMEVLVDAIKSQA